MKQCSFSVELKNGEKSELVSFDEMLELFDIYRYKPSDEQFVFFPKKELTGSDSPALYCQTNDANYNEKKIEQITCTPEFNKDVFHKKNDYEEISIGKVPQDIRTAILEPIKENFTEALIKYHQKKKA